MRAIIYIMTKQKVALYRKYRPENFDQVVGQEHIVRILKNAVLKDKISHAYLFSGPRGTGKTSVARILAKAINCEKRTGHNPCGKCSVCKNIKEGQTMDLLEIDAASNRGIDEIRDLREKVKFAPTDSKFKVFIIDEVHMLTKEAFNALLKTLEEPPEHAIFVLATTEINKVPSTIISRCQRHDFKRIKLTEIVGRLITIAKSENIKIDDESLEMIAEAAEGGLRDALSILDQLSSTGLKSIKASDVEDMLGLTPHKTVYQFLKSILEGEQKKALKIAVKLTKEGSDIVIFTKSLEEFIGKLITAKVTGTDDIEGTKEQIEEIKGLTEKYELLDFTSLADGINWAQTNFKSGVEPGFILTLLAVSGKNKGKDLDNVKVPKPKTEIATNSKPSPVKDKRTNGQWQHALMEIKSKNNTLYAFMRVATPNFTKSELLLTFPYKFHKEKIEETKHKKMVEEIVAKVYGKDYQIKCNLAGNGNGGKGQVDNTNAASILGGELVED